MVNCVMTVSCCINPDQTPGQGLLLWCSLRNVSESGRLTMSIFQAVDLWQLRVRLKPLLLHVSVCLQGKQIKDASHFRGCKSAPGDGSGLSDTPNPPRAASTYRLPIHVSSKRTLHTSSVIKCSRNKPCYLFK